MSHVPHEIHDEFPGEGDRIHSLKLSDHHFARLLDDYHLVNRAVHRAETRVDMVSEAEEAGLRRRRAMIKDQIARRLA